jgi:hypothetical protein
LGRAFLSVQTTPSERQIHAAKAVAERILGQSGMIRRLVGVVGIFSWMQPAGRAIEQATPGTTTSVLVGRLDVMCIN